MDTQTAPTRNIDVVHGEGAEEEHHEKSPMFKKMKDKVKKIKHSINKKVHGPGGRQQHDDLDEGDEGQDNDEEMVDPEVHGAPIYDSSSPRATEATTLNRPNAVGGPDESSGGHASVGAAQNWPNAVGGSDERSDARARVVETDQNRSNVVGGRDESSEARARVETVQNRPNAVGGTDESSYARSRVGTAQDRPNAVGGSDESLDARAKVGTDQDRSKAVGDPDESLGGRASVGTAQDQPFSVEGPDENLEVRPRVGTAQDRPNPVGGYEGDGAAGLGSITSELAKDPAPPKTSSTESATKEQSKGGEELPELSRSFEALAVSNQAQDLPEGRAEDQLSKDKNSSYTEKITSAKDAAVSAASMVYGKVAVAGTAMMGKVKPEAGKGGGEHENLEKTQDKGVSMKDYLVEKLTPGEDDKALSAKITEAVQWKKDAAPVTPQPREVTESGEAGGGMGVVGKMRGTVSSFLGGGGSSPKSVPATESPTKVAEDTKDFHSRPTEAVSQGDDDNVLSAKDAAPVSPPAREVNGSGEAGGGIGVVGKMRETVTSFLGGGGSSPKSAQATGSPTKEAVHKEDASPVTPPPREVTESNEAGGGTGMVGRIRETVTSFLGGGGSSPKSAPATESPTKVAEDKDFPFRPTEALSQEKDAK